MVRNLTPYDRGERLEPHVWVHEGGVTGKEFRRPSVPGDYGRVDFDDDAGLTILNLYIERVDNGYQMQVEQLGDDYVHVTGANEPPVLRGPSAELDPEYRARQMMLLDAGLQEIASAFGEHVVYTDEGDPFAFHPGNFYFYPAAGKDGTCFAIEEEFALGSDWADEERVPIGWSWREYGLIRLPDGTEIPDCVAEGATIPSDIDSLLTRARAWAQTVSANAAGDDLEHSIRHDDPHRDHPSL